MDIFRGLIRHTMSLYLYPQNIHQTKIIYILFCIFPHAPKKRFHKNFEKNHQV